MSKIGDLLKLLPRKGGGQGVQLSLTVSSRTRLVLYRAVENEPKQLLNLLLHKFHQKSQEDPRATCRKEQSLLNSQDTLLVPIAAPSPPLGTAEPEAAPAPASPKQANGGL